MRHLSFAATALLLTGACSENGLRAIPDATLAGPRIEVTPSRLDFGEAGSETVVVKEFMVRNIGLSDLSVEDLLVLGHEDSYQVLGFDGPLTLAPDAVAVIDVQFTPRRADAVIGYIEVISNDSQQSAVEVDLVGQGMVPALEIDPPVVDFGTVDIGCDESESVALRNVGNEPLVIDGLDFDGDVELELASGLDLPLTLQPGESTQVEVRFAPMDEQSFDGVLAVHSNDPRGVVEGVQEGEGTYDDSVVERFDMPVAPPVDILFAIDQSCSMEDDATRLATNFASFVSQIDAVTRGWRVGVATRDNGCFLYGALDRTTSGYQSKFTSSVLSWDGGSYTESLLTVARNALRESAAGCNRGFLRPEANLHLILVSDEPEQSSGGWASLVSQIRDLHPTDRSRVKISAVAGDYPSGCGTAMAGEGYYQAVRDTGGEFLSICDTNWARHVDKLAKASIDGLGQFELSQTPDLRTLHIYVNSGEWTEGWRLQGRTLVFDTAPPEGAVITVEYRNLACQ